MAMETGLHIICDSSFEPLLNTFVTFLYYILMNTTPRFDHSFKFFITLPTDSLLTYILNVYFNTSMFFFATNKYLMQ